MSGVSFSPSLVMNETPHGYGWDTGNNQPD